MGCVLVGSVWVGWKRRVDRIVRGMGALNKVRMIGLWVIMWVDGWMDGWYQVAGGDRRYMSAFAAAFISPALPSLPATFPASFPPLTFLSFPSHP